jgi:phosphatidate cytidylyltransferase
MIKSNLLLRLLSAAILIPVVLGAVFYGNPYYNILIALMGACMGWEWETMVRGKFSPLGMIIGTAAVIVSFTTAEMPEVSLLVILAAAAIVYFKSEKNVLLTFGTFYVGLPVASMIYIYYIKDATSVDIVLWLLFVIWATDTGGYIVGKTVGGPKLLPKISPKKTWAGLIGAMIFAGGVSYGFALLREVEGFSPMLLAGIGAVMAVISQAGDFFESWIKRRLNLKDSSQLIPGHGGIFDRVDGLLFTAPVVAAILIFINLGILP